MNQLTATGASSTSNVLSQQTGTKPFEDHQKLSYTNAQWPPCQYNGLTDRTVPAQNVDYYNDTYPPSFINGDPSYRLGRPVVESQPLVILNGSFSSLQNENYRKKTPRALLACRQCRDAKAKCENGKPCQKCRDSGKECDYKTPEPKAGLSNVIDRLDTLEGLLQKIEANSNALLNKLHSTIDLSALAERPKMKGLDFRLTVPLYHMTAASNILPWKFVRVLIGENVLDTVTSDATTYSAWHSQTKGRSLRDFNDSELDLSSETSNRLLIRYVKHVHIIHPILSPAHLKFLFKSFIESSNPAISMSKANNNETRRLKRKRPIGDAEALNDGFIGSKIGEPSIELVTFLLILALGKVYDHREELANAFHKGGEEPGGSDSARNSYPLPKEVDRSSKNRHPSVNGSAPPNLGNMDITPGLDYFVAATDIIGKIDYRESQSYVTVQILTSLYQRQLGQLSKSHAAISEAARVLQVIMRNKITKASTTASTTKWNDALLITFWSCLQIESEIVVELPVPQSSLNSWEQFMPWPNEQAENFINDIERGGYKIALRVRKCLNTIIPKLYGYGRQETVDNVLLEGQTTSSLVQSTVDNSEDCLLEVTKLSNCNSGDPNYIAMSTARLESKILAVKVIALRPYLMMVLNREHVDISQKARDYARLCIEAIQRGASTFWCLKDDRLVAYTHCGHAMILLATFCDASLKHLVEFDLLRYLVRQVLDSLKAWPSSELAQKYVKVLEAMAMKAGLNEQHKLQNNQHF